VIRKTLRQLGGLTEKCLPDELKEVFATAGIQSDRPTYDLRESISTELEEAGVSLLVQRYVTAHGTKDIQNHYVGLRPVRQMQKHFVALAPLLGAIIRRARELGIDLPTPGSSEAPTGTGSSIAVQCPRQDEPQDRTDEVQVVQSVCTKGAHSQLPAASRSGAVMNESSVKSGSISKA
jgi:hypothetical protein